MKQKYRQLIADTLIWMKDNPHVCLSRAQSHHFFSDIKTPSSSNLLSPPTSSVDYEQNKEIQKLLERAAPDLTLKTKPSLVALVFYSQTEALFYEKLKQAIEKHLSPACLIDAAHWSQERKKFTPRWILATKKITEEEETPLIQLSLPEFYQNNLEAKKALWKLLCQRLALPQSS